MTQPPATRLCVSIVRNNPSLEQQVARAVAQGAEIIELRVDRIEDAAAVERLLHGPRRVPFILTIRSAAEGGGWDGDDAERIALYERFGLLMPGFVDIELATLERSANLRQKVGLIAHMPNCPAGETGQAVSSESASRVRNTLIVSMHDYRTTPDDLSVVLNRLIDSGASIIKAAFTPDDARDALRILTQLARVAPHRPAIVIGMGESGVATRILARKFGAFLSFATVEAGQTSAPGQLTLHEMQGVYRWFSIDRSTRVFGLVGWPTSHSRSPQIHNAAMAQCGINAIYLPFPVRAGYESFAQFMQNVNENPHLDIDGLSVTIPHKENAYRWLKEQGGSCSALAERCRAVNTLRKSGGTWTGNNTDAIAMTAILSSAISGVSAAAGRRVRILVLGAGGVARAAVAAAKEQGADIAICNRTPERAATLAGDFGGALIRWEQRAEAVADVLIQCTSVGMWPGAEECPMPGDALPSVACVVETIYNPRTTRLLRVAAQRGCRTVDGAELFIRQAEAQFEYWHGQRPPEGLMRCVLEESDGVRP